MVFEGDVNMGQAPPQIGVWVTLGDAGDTKGHRKQIWPSFLEPRLNEAECKRLHDFLKTKYGTSKHFLACLIPFPAMPPVGQGL